MEIMRKYELGHKEMSWGGVSVRGRLQNEGRAAEREAAVEWSHLQ